VDVMINEIDSRVRVTDVESLLSPEVMAMIVRMVKQQLENERRMQRHAEDDRRLVEGASR